MIAKIWHLLQRTVKQLFALPKNIKYYGIKVSYYIFKDRVLLGKVGKEKYIEVIQAFTDNYFSELVEEYKNKEFTLPSSPHVNTVWCCWWQGEAAMPEIVKMCTESIKASLPEGVEYILITKDNFKEYVDIPKYILEKLEKGIMSITAFSDILRVNLISRYGGFWIDATVCIPNKLPEDYFQKVYFTQKFSSYDVCKGEACRGKWAGFLQCGASEFLIFSYVRDAYNKWWLEHDALIDYVILDYMLMSAYNGIPYIKEIIDTVPPNNEQLWQLSKLLEQPYNEAEFKEIFANQYFNKLARTLTPKKEIDGKLTYYGYLCKKYLHT